MQPVSFSLNYSQPSLVFLCLPLYLHPGMSLHLTINILFLDKAYGNFQGVTTSSNYKLDFSCVAHSKLNATDTSMWFQIQHPSPSPWTSRKQSQEFQVLFPPTTPFSVVTAVTLSKSLPFSGLQTLHYPRVHAWSCQNQLQREPEPHSLSGSYISRKSTEGEEPQREELGLRQKLLEGPSSPQNIRGHSKSSAILGHQCLRSCQK